MRFLFVGRDIRIAAYWAQRILHETDIIQKIKKIVVWNTAAYIRKNKLHADLSIVEINGFTRRFIPANTGFILPRWIEVELLPLKILKKEAIKDITRRIRKNKLSFKIMSHSDNEFRFFFDRMYVPNITNRHGDAAVHSDYRYFLNKYKQKGSYMGYIYQDETPVAGTLIEYINRDYIMFAMGILDGREDILKMGVAGALYYFTALHCIEKGIDNLNIGGTSPVLTDGLTKFKISLGAEMADTDYLGDQKLWMLPLKDSPALRGVLRHNPFVYETGKRFNIAIFMEEDECTTKEELEKVLDHAYIEKIHATSLYCFNGNNSIKNLVDGIANLNINVVSYQI
ncbi:MAG: hypothetical protein JXB00_11460 [Bacteroidales bacterium]|nr:hypothetical protein [Bacteroidales bacterium]